MAVPVKLADYLVQPIVTAFKRSPGTDNPEVARVGGASREAGDDSGAPPAGGAPAAPAAGGDDLYDA